MSALKLSYPLQTLCRCALYRVIPLSTTSAPTTVDQPVEATSEDISPVRPTGWSPPRAMPAPPGVTPHIPFRVRRSKFRQLPVYTDYKNGRSRVLTKISKIDGDIERAEQLLREYLQVDNLRCKVDDVTGSILINGNYRTEVRAWLKSLGF